MNFVFKIFCPRDGTIVREGNSLDDYTAENLAPAYQERCPKCGGYLFWKNHWMPRVASIEQNHA